MSNYADFSIDCKDCGACMLPYKIWKRTDKKKLFKAFRQTQTSIRCKHKNLLIIEIEDHNVQTST